MTPIQIIKAARGRITSPFGARSVPGSHVPNHLGIDLGHGNMTAADTDLVAPAEGRVTAVGQLGTYGLRIVIDHGIIDGARWETLLAHASEIDVAVDDWLAQRNHVGVMGNSGTTAVHCHQELRRNGVPVNPETYLTSSPAGLSTSTIVKKVALMPPIILFGVDTRALAPYSYNPYTGRRHFLTPHELSIQRSATPPPQEMTVSQAALDSLPKEVGTR